MTKHEGFTPGPWKVSPVVCDGNFVYARIGPKGRGSIAYSGVYGPKKQNAMLSEAEAEANARLIADAPRLYAENQRLRDVMRRVAYGLAVDARTLDGMTKDAAVTTLLAALGADA